MSTFPNTHTHTHTHTCTMDWLYGNMLLIIPAMTKEQSTPCSLIKNYCIKGSYDQNKLSQVAL